MALPGFVESRTHLVAAGSREQEYALCALGASYQEIAAAGGGILSTVRCSRRTLGEKKKLAVARALALRPRLLLLDEVMAGLAADERADLMRLVGELHRAGTAIVMVEHVGRVGMALAWRVVVLDRGGKPAAVAGGEDSMNVGLMLNTEYPATDDPARRLAEHREQVRLAREAGFDLVGIPHHPSRGPSFWLPPLLTAAAVAGEVGAMRLATTVFLLPLHHPVEVAEQVAMLDHLAGGRLVFGVGAGWQPEEFRALGVPMDGRLGRLEESLAVIERLWTGERVTFRGRHVVLDDVALTLRPAQRPRPPVWIGANASEAAVRRAARLADAWIVSSHPDIDAVARHVETYRQALAELGKPFPAELPVLRNAYVAPDMDTALAEARGHFEASYEVFGDWGLFERVLRAGARQLRGADLLRGRLIIGSPEDCLEQVAACRAQVPVGCLILRMQWLGMPHARVARAIELVGEKLLPALRRL